MVRPSDQERTAGEKTVNYSHFPKAPGTGAYATPCRVTCGSTGVSLEAEGVGGKRGQRLYNGFLGRERVGQDKQV